MPYVIDTMKELAGEVEDVPMLSFKGKKEALLKLTGLTDQAFEILNHPAIRNVSGRIEYVLQRCQGITGLGVQEVIHHVVVKRPLNSPCAMIYVDGQRKEVDDGNSVKS